MLIVQYVLLALIVGFVLKTASSLRKRKIHFADFLLWLLFWGVVAAIVVWPQATQYLAELIGIGRGADLIVYLGLMGLYFFFYNTLVKVKQLDEKITLLGRQIAIDKAHTTVDDRSSDN